MRSWHRDSGPRVDEEGRFKFWRDATEEADGLGVRSDDEGDGVTTGVRLVDGGGTCSMYWGPRRFPAGTLTNSIGEEIP